METQQIKFVAQGIRDVFRRFTPVIMSWGAIHFKETVYNNMPGLRFSVKGFLFQGTVVVVLNMGADLYEVYCLDAAENVVKSRDGVYCDELVDVIDELVEKDSTDQEYSDKVNEWLMTG